MGEEVEIKEGVELGQELQEILVKNLLLCNPSSKRCEICPLDKEVEVVVEMADLGSSPENFGRAEISKTICRFLKEIAYQIQ